MNNSIPLSALLTYLKNVVNESMDGFFWVRAEISNVKVQNISKHYYFEIIERDSNGKPIAKMNGTCWKGKAEQIIPKLENKLNKKISAGIICDFKITINYDILYGLSLNIIDIIPAFSIGEHEKKKEKIRETISSLGIHNNQKSMNVPDILTSIAILAPSSAAGFGDFISEAKKWHNNEYIKLKSYSAIFEGSQTEESISSAIKSIKIDNEKHKLDTGFDLYDLVIVLRGGGAKSSLAHLDELNIVKDILEINIPVWCAIGHEEDSVLLDEYSNRFFHTPSKAAGEIWNIIKKERDNFTNILNNIKKQSELKTLKVLSEVSSIKDRIKIKSINKVEMSLKNIQFIKDKIKLNDPFLILKNGYSVLYTEDYKLIKDEEELLNSKSVILKTSFGDYNIILNNITKRG